MKGIYAWSYDPEWIMKVKFSGSKSSFKFTLISMQLLVSDIFEHV